jgi:hypothetical protein
MPSEINRYFLFKFSLMHQASFIKKSVFCRFGVYNTNYAAASDYEYFLKLIKVNRRFKKIDTILAIMDDPKMSASVESIKERILIMQHYFSKKAIRNFSKQLIEERICIAGRLRQNIVKGVKRIK